MARLQQKWLQDKLATLPEQPGVYQMLGQQGAVLYVGKAKNLQRRVKSYFRGALNHRLQVMVAQVVDIQITLTGNEWDALLLENDLIKAHQPRFNVLLRDDKSYPYLVLTMDDQFPRIGFHRGSRHPHNRYFGPYPSAGAARATLKLVQQLFLIRQCSDPLFRNRSRPCLEYQMHHCTAPCVGLINEQAYAEDVARCIQFLDGRVHDVISELTTRMEQAAQALEFEQAALWRDRIAHLSRISSHRDLPGLDDTVDLIAIVHSGGLACIELFFIRGGRNLGHRPFFLPRPDGSDNADILASFLSQFYATNQPAPSIVVNMLPTDHRFLIAALTKRLGLPVRLRRGTHPNIAPWMTMAVRNARQALHERLQSLSSYSEQLVALQQLLGLQSLPQRLECFDVSHTFGEKTQASCVVFGTEGPLFAEYRRFNIEGITPGDDYAALSQALQRRCHNAPIETVPKPDVILIDGGLGQVNTVAKQLAIHPFWRSVVLIGVAKGRARRPGDETLWRPDSHQPIIPVKHSPALHLIQRIRDEAHRFAITGHRRRRDLSRKTSALQRIPGVGPKRCQQLLKTFGGWQGLYQASLEEIHQVPGIGVALGTSIYNSIHSQLPLS
jgi:excinuclease ABC subunit C